MDPFWRYRSGWLPVVFCLVLPWAAAGQDRLALVIGNSQYDKGRLRNPGSDADALEAALQPLDFKVTKRKDLDKEGLEAAVRDFYRSLTRGCVALFFYAGHGLQVNGENYLVPVRTAVDEEFEVSNKCYPLSQVLAALDRSPSSLKIIILDCCRDNPYQRSWQRSSGAAGLAAIGNAPEGTLIAFSTAPGKVAADGTGNNSPYTRHLCAVLKSRPAEGLELLEVFRRVGREVNRDTDKTQHPWNNNAVYEEFYFVRRASSASSVTPLAWTSPPDVRPSVPPPVAPSERTITNSIGMQLVRIEAGEFLMGSPESEEGRDSDEGPQHRVRITQPFYLGAYEVTQGQYEAVMGSNPSEFKGTNRPVEKVSWDEAVEFCRRLSTKEGRTYRLPTEAEWEYACRAGTTTAYSFGNSVSELGGYAWFDGNAGSQTHDVGQKQPNGWGLYDMHGNVWEWCSDWFGEDYYATSPVDDPKGPAAGSYRVSRGGSWFRGPGRCRSAYRGRFTPGSREGNLGFRPALVAD